MKLSHDDLANSEANYFASALLMPRDEFIKSYNEYNGNVIKLAKKFNVHTIHVRYRIGHLRQQDKIKLPGECKRFKKRKVCRFIGSHCGDKPCIIERSGE